MKFFREKEIKGHSGAVYTCGVDSALGYLYSGGADKYVVRWRLEDGMQDKFAIQFDYSIYSIKLINSHLIAVGLSSGDLHFFDPIEGKELKFYKQHTVGIFCIQYNELEKQLYVGDADGNLSIWNTENLELILYLPLDCGKIRSISVNSDGSRFSIACQDGTIRIFEVNFFNEIHTIEAHKNGTTSVLFHPTAKNQLVSGGKDALLKLWDWTTEKELHSIIAHTFSIYDLISLDKGNRLITASRDKMIKVWDFNTMNIVERLDLKRGGHRHSVNRLAAINEDSFVSCSDDKRMLIWKSI